MNAFIGRKLAIGLKEEAVKGTAENTPAMFLPISGSPEFNDVVEKQVNENSGGTNFEGVGDRISKIMGAGKIEGILGADSIAYLFKGLFGKVTTVDNGDNTYKHSFDVEAGAHPSFSYFKYDPIQGYVYPGAMTGNVEISAGDKVSYSAEVTSKQGIKGTVTPAYTTEQDFAVGHAEVKYADDVAGLGAVTPICAKDIKITVDKGLLENQCLGDVSIKTPTEGVISINGEFNALYTKADFNDDLVGDLKRAIQLTFLDTSKVIGNGSANPKVQITLHNVKLQGTPVVYPSSDFAMVTVSFKGYLDLDTGKAITAEVTNTIASV